MASTGDPSTLTATGMGDAYRRWLEGERISAQRIRTEQEMSARERSVRNWATVDPTNGDVQYYHYDERPKEAPVPEPEPIFNSLGDMLLYKHNGIRYV